MENDDNTEDRDGDNSIVHTYTQGDRRNMTP